MEDNTVLTGITFSNATHESISDYVELLLLWSSRSLSPGACQESTVDQRASNHRSKLPYELPLSAEMQISLMMPTSILHVLNTLLLT